MLIEISLGIATLAFVVLVIYIVIGIRGLLMTLRQTHFTLINVNNTIDLLTQETQKTVQEVNVILTDVKEKLKFVHPIFKSFENLGEILEKRTDSFREDYENQSTKKKSGNSQVHRIAEILELTGMGIHLWQKIKEGEKKHGL